MQNFTRLFVLILLCAITTSLDAQRRYLDPIFDEVEVSNITPVATNYTILPWLFAALAGQPGHTQRQPLVTQFYTPKGDTETNRPLVVYIHTGNFFPFPQNGSCGGTMRDSSNIEIATRLAKMGYVVAVVNYRQGWNPFDPQELVRRFFLINAAYRGAQDMKTYVRYFRRSVKDLGNPHGIDPDKITLWGQGTGGYLSLASAYLNQYSEILTTSDPDKFMLPTSATTKIPMVIEAYNGKLEANGPTTVVDAMYNAISKLPVGDTLCVSNHVNYADGSPISSNFALAVNAGGALGDSTWINAGEVPIISYHNPSDAFAPYNTDILNVPTAVGPQPVVEVSGSYDVQSIARRLGVNDIFNTIPVGADPYGDIKNIDGLNALCAFSNTPNNDTSAPWEWTDTTNVNLMAMNCNANGLIARTYIDTIVGYFAPRACVALGLNCDFKVSVDDLNDLDVKLVMAPNPASEAITFSTSFETPIQGFKVYNLSGTLLANTTNINSSKHTLQRGNMNNGVYIVQLQFEKGILTKRIIFN